MDRPDIDSVQAPQPYVTAQIANVIAAVHELRHPIRIGPYEIVELIGEGEWLGLQSRAAPADSSRRRHQIIKLGMDTRQVMPDSNRSVRRWR